MLVQATVWILEATTKKTSKNVGNERLIKDASRGMMSVLEKRCAVGHNVRCTNVGKVSSNHYSLHGKS